jgi:hypothetical protein
LIACLLLGYWLFIAARMLPLAYAGPPTHLCTVACTVDNNPITIFVNLSVNLSVTLSSLIHVLNTNLANLHTNFPRDTSRSKLRAKLRIPLCSSVGFHYVCLSAREMEIGEILVNQLDIRVFVCALLTLSHASGWP